MVGFKLSQMTCGKLQLVQKNRHKVEMTPNKPQLNFKNHGKVEIKSNNSW
jgi:hypothetical protein